MFGSSAACSPAVWLISAGPSTSAGAAIRTKGFHAFARFRRTVSLALLIIIFSSEVFTAVLELSSSCLCIASGEYSSACSHVMISAILRAGIRSCDSVLLSTASNSGSTDM